MTHLHVPCTDVECRKSLGISRCQTKCGVLPKPASKDTFLVVPFYHQDQSRSSIARLNLPLLKFEVNTSWHLTITLTLTSKLHGFCPKLEDSDAFLSDVVTEYLDISSSCNLDPLLLLICF